jgi:hypothetical protein
MAFLRDLYEAWWHMALLRSSLGGPRASGSIMPMLSSKKRRGARMSGKAAVVGRH